MRSQSLLIVLSAPSGGGKTSISKRLLQVDPDLVRSVSATTRLPRKLEKHGQDYYFLNLQEFKRLLRQNRFLEWARVHGHYYGTLRAEVKKKRAQGRDVLLVIDVQGGLQVKRMDPAAVLIFVKPPAFTELANRLRHRDTDSDQTIQERLQNARREMRVARQYDYVVVNERLYQATRQVRAIITAERLRAGNFLRNRKKKLGRISK
jgi:guanylate kinase